MLIGLQEMSIKELTESTLTTYLGIRDLDYTTVSFTTTESPDSRSRRLEYWSCHPWEYLDEIGEKFDALGVNGN